ncbi:Uncharacterised protein [Vibrio cholerae]|nr:Uncharacterised protein [Vibrio cholerae]CSB17906.1 Uncharacterised protein [Vibrio cholerae]CSC24115.1 Uncharacterised protein [Vibrio cholerae]CSI68684.1 Uncharacterised protein [Vibrio cholerae]
MQQETEVMRAGAIANHTEVVIFQYTEHLLRVAAALFHLVADQSNQTQVVFDFDRT